MASNIAELNGESTLSYFGATPWHGLGTQVTDIAIARDLQASLVAANLNDWNVHTQPLFLGDGRVNEHSKAVVRGRDNTILGAVGPNTHLVQNEEAFAVVEPLLQQFGAHVEIAGALGNGSRTWVLVKLSEQSFEVGPGDRHDAFLFVRHAHDNTLVTEGIPTFIRVVCANTTAAAVQQAGGEHTDKGRIFRIKKTADVHNRLKQAETLVRRLAEAAEYTGRTFSRLASEEINPQQIAEYIESVFPLPSNNGVEKDSKTITERRKAVAKLVFTQPGAALAGSDASTGTSTAYAAYNAITHYFDHVRPQEAQKASAKTAAATSALFGQNAALKALALAKARELVHV